MAETSCAKSISLSRLLLKSHQSHLRALCMRECSLIRLYSTKIRQRRPNFAFVFDIDGVILRSAKPIIGARSALAQLQKNDVPFIFLTNGGGKFESDRVSELKEKLQLSFNDRQLVQSHTPLADLAGQYSKPGVSDGNVLVVGGDGDLCRGVAERYGFRSVITPADIITAQPSLWPFSKALSSHYESYARPLPSPISQLKIDAIFVFNDSRDWGLDTQLITDLLLSRHGVLGTRSPMNNRSDLPNRGYQSDGQPRLWFSNPDLQWAASHHLPRLGQGAFIEAFEGVWNAITGGPRHGVHLRKTLIGKPYSETYSFAERRLADFRADEVRRASNAEPADGLQTIYMIGDNPASDITGANNYESHLVQRDKNGLALAPPNWMSILVKTGVYRESEGKPEPAPSKISGNVLEAVKWAMQREGWEWQDDADGETAGLDKS